MKKYLALLLFVVLTTVSFSQSNYQDVVYLKNGSIIRGMIIEQIPNKSVKIKTVNGNVFAYQMDEVDKLTREREAIQGKKPSTRNDSGQNFGLKGGLNLSNMLMKDDDDTYSDDFKINPGFHIGATAEFPLAEMLSFETGLLLSTKGFKISEEETIMGETIEMEGKTNLLYLDIPLTAKATFDLGGAKIYGVFGPYVGMGLSGKRKYEMTYDGETESDEEDVEWGSDEDESDLKRLDFGLTMGAGVEINSIQIGLTYGLGLANISPYTDGGAKINNRVLGLSVGYKFGGK